MITQLQEPVTAKQVDSLYYPDHYDYSANFLKTDISEQTDIPKSKHGLYVSEKTYWDEYYEDPDFNYEWNNGILEEKEMPTSLSDLIKQWIETLVLHYLNANPIARQVKSELGFVLDLPHKKSIRKPDYSLILHSNSEQMEDQDCSYGGIYDLCIEYLSETKKEYVYKDTVVKKEEYCGGNVTEYYIIDSRQTHTAFYRLVNKGKKNQYYKPIKPKNGVIQSRVLPGFQFRVKDLYLRPDPELLYKNKIYQSYVKVDYQNILKEKEIAIQDKNNAIKILEQEKKAKEEALKEIDRLKQLLSAQMDYQK